MVPGGGEAWELWVVGDAPTRCHEGAATNTRTLAATSHSNLLPPTAVADAHSYLPNRGLAGIEPEQPNRALRRVSVRVWDCVMRCAGERRNMTQYDDWPNADGYRWGTGLEFVSRVTVRGRTN